MKQYPEYKDSGVDWMDQIPSHWLIIPFRRVIAFLTDFEANGSFSSLSDNVVDDYEIKHAWFVRATDLENKNYETFQECRFINETSYQYLLKTKLFGDELLIAKRGEIGKVYLMPKLDIRASLAPNLYLLRLVNERISPSFAYYYFVSEIGRSQLINANKSTTIGALYKDDCKKLELIYPPLSEQSQITAFLDHKTRLINDLIAKKQKLIELLQEERTALINQAVTKGLDPSVPMKDTGIEWLGEIPEHWEVVRLKFIAKSVKTGNTPPSEKDEYYENPDTDWFTPSDFDGGLYLDDSQRKINAKAIEDGVAKIFNPLSVLIIGIGATLGKIGIIKKSASSNQQINAIEFNDLMNPIFAAYFLKSFEPVIRNMSNAATLAILNQTSTKNLLLSCPPKQEQDKIALHIEDTFSGFDSTISRIHKEIQLIAEYKTALINEAVTGKIDVRDHPINHASIHPQ